MIILYFHDAWCNSCGNVRFTLQSVILRYNGTIWHIQTHTREVIPASVWHCLSSFSAERLFILFLAPSWQPNWSQSCRAVGGTGLQGHSCSPPTAESNVWVIQPVLIFHIRVRLGIIFMLHCLPLQFSKVITILFRAACIFVNIPSLNSTTLFLLLQWRLQFSISIKSYSRIVIYVCADVLVAFSTFYL